MGYRQEEMNAKLKEDDGDGSVGENIMESTLGSTPSLCKVLFACSIPGNKCLFQA